MDDHGENILILAGDIGGTNTRLAIFTPALDVVDERATKNLNRPSLTDIVREFLAAYPNEAKQIDRACFGVAGPVSHGHVKTTNLPWELDVQDLSRDLNIPKVALVNDLVAHAEGIEVLKPEHFVTLSAGEPDPHGNRAVIAAGTGLGEAGLVWDPDIKGYRAFASEGGHCDFSPRTDQEFALAKFIQQKKGVATWERVLSGPGLRRIYDFLLSTTPPQSGSLIAGSLPADPTPEQIGQAGMNKTNPIAFAALNLFVHFYASEAGNLALKLLATGGVYLSGGIATNLLDKLKSDAFLDSFRSKGPDKLAALMNRIPIHVVTLETCALFGAGNYARRL